MSWQVDFALEILGRVPSVTSMDRVGNEAIKIAVRGQPETFAVIADDDLIDEASAGVYHGNYPAMNFLCGMRKTCVLDGGAIGYVERHSIGWGNIGTLDSALRNGTVKSAGHKDFAFSDRLLRQSRIVKEVAREFDRVHTVVVKSGRKIRIGMIREYEPTSDHVRSLWDQFGPVDVAWNINPNGRITGLAIKASQELGCEVMKWAGLKEYLERA